MTEANEGTGQSEKRLVNVSATFIANPQTTAAVEPGKSAFNNPTVAAEALGGLDAATSDARADMPLAGGASATWEVIAFVCVELRRPAAWGATRLADAWDRIQQGGEAQRVVRVRRANERGKRKPAAFHKEVMLGAELAAVGRVPPGLRPPFGAGTLAASRLARDQSIWPARPNRSKST